MAAHARIGPSAAARWIRCPASVRLSDPNTSPFPDKLILGTSPAAAIGTVLHGEFERSLLEGAVVFRSAAADRIKALKGDVRASLASLRIALDATHRLIEQFDLVDVQTEVRVHPGARIGERDLWGTADLVARSEDGTTIAVIDLKMGRHRVAADSEQLAVYALGLREHWPDANRVLCAIVQPAVSSGADVCIRTADQLDAFEHQVRAAVAAINDASTPPTPDPAACRWCPARECCPARGSGAFDHLVVDEDAFG